MVGKYTLLGLLLGTSASLLAQSGTRVELGRLQTGATVSFVRSGAGQWGIEIAGSAAPRISQPKPARLEISREDNALEQLAAGYKTVKKSSDGIDARAELAYENVVFRVQDRWTL